MSVSLEDVFINLTGSFLIGLVLTLATRAGLAAPWRLLLVTGFFGRMKPVRSMIVGCVAIGASMAINLVPIVAAGGVRAIVASERQRDYAEAARAAGAGHARVLFRHLLPAAAGHVGIQATLLLSDLGRVLMEPAVTRQDLLNALDLCLEARQSQPRRATRLKRVEEELRQRIASSDGAALN